MKLKSHPTIKDVAKQAGVSITTVSFVINNRADVVISEEVKKRVQRIAQELDYHPSALAAGLAGRRTRNLGVVFYPEDKIISNQFYSFVIEGIVKETIEKGFNLYFSYLASSHDGYQSLPKIIREKNVDGVILIGRNDPVMVEEIKNRRIPVVAIDNYPELTDVDTIRMNNIQGGLLATSHLLELGHRHIGHLTLRGRPSLEGRQDGWKKAHAQAGMDFNPDYLFECETFNLDGGYEKAKEVLKKHKKLTALFCANDEVAAGALRAARELGRRVPEDLSIVGFDNVAISLCVDPPLTTVNVPKEEMGKSAVHRLFELIENKESLPKNEEVSLDLVIRKSTAKI